MSEPWIELGDVHLSRGGRPVLQGISARLSGRAVGLVGANGAGKSTLIGALLGVLKADRGTVRVLDCDLPGDALEVRTRAGVMAEQAGIFPGGSGVEAVVFAGMLSGLPKQEALRRAHRALDALDVGEERYRPTAGYSTGMRQRCKMAMSLVHNPEFLVLDEPTVGLDPPGRVQLLELIRGLRDEGRRILISTHILHDAEFLCDEILMLDAGTVAYCGSVEAMVGPGAGRLVATGTGLDHPLAARLAAAGVGATAAGTTADGAGRIVLDVSAPGQLAAFWRIVDESGAEVRGLDRDVPTLEQALVTAMDAARGEPS